jgi:hypothetical protein
MENTNFQEIEFRDQLPVNRQVFDVLKMVRRELHQLTEKVNHMATVQQQADTDLSTAINVLATVIAQYVTAVNAQLALTTGATADPAVLDAISNVKSLTATLEADLAALTPAPTTPATPAPTTSAPATT